MGNGSGVSRGDRNRNAKLSRLRELVPVTNAVVGIDLADNKQMVVVTDHDSKVLARRTLRCKAWDLVGVGLGRRAVRGERLRRGDGLVRANRAQVAGAGPARWRAGDAVRVRAADADFLGQAQRGPHL